MMHLFNNDRLRDLSKSCPTLDATQFLALKHIECASEWIEGIPQFRVTQKGNVVKNNALLEDVMSRARKGGFCKCHTIRY